MWHDLRFGLRRLARAPVVSLTVTLTLAAGVGALTTAYTVGHGVLAPLDYPQPERLVRIYETLRSLKDSPNPRLAAMWNELPVSYSDANDWRHGSRALSGIALYLDYRAVLEAGGEPLEVAAARIDSNLLRVLGVAPELGRPFDAGEVAHRERLALLGHDLWTGVFGADRRILGRAVRLDGQQYTVVGVMPAGFALPGRQDRLWTPAGPRPEDLENRDEYDYSAVGRLAAGTDREQAQAELDRLASRLAAAYPATNASTGVRLAPLLDTVIGDSRRVVALLAAAAAAVLLVACVNLAHVLLAQGAERRNETALRQALGARTRDRLLQSGAEILPAAVAGSAAGLILAGLARRALPVLLAAELPRAERIAIDGQVVLFAFSTGVAAALVSALLPAVFSPDAALRQAIGGRRLARAAQDGLVVAEIALTLMLTVGALALAASWLHLAAVDPGFDARGLLVQEIRLPAWRYPDEVRRRELAARLLASLEALPGASGAALVSRLPGPGPVEVWGFRIAGRDPPARDWTQGRSAVMLSATSGFLRLLRIPLFAGQPVDGTVAAAPEGAGFWAVLVNHAMAERHWPRSSPLGAELLMHSHLYRVEGVFGDVRYQGPAAGAGELMIQPWQQGPVASFAALVRVAGGRPLDQAAAVRRAVRGLDPSLPLPAAARLEDLVARSAVGPRSRALLVGLSAGVALLLALIGTYGVMAYGIGRRRREIAIRMAAGADRRWVRRWVLRRALALAVTGVLLGTLGALASRRLLAGLLFGVVAADLRGLAAAGLLLIVTCLAAAYFPARRASQIDPAAVLRSE